MFSLDGEGHSGCRLIALCTLPIPSRPPKPFPLSVSLYNRFVHNDDAAAAAGAGGEYLGFSPRVEYLCGSLALQCNF